MAINKYKTRLRNLFEYNENRQDLKPSSLVNEKLNDIFYEIVQWDTFVAGLVSSFLKKGEDAIDDKVLDKALVDLPRLLKEIIKFNASDERELAYKKNYTEWINSLLKMAELLDKSIIRQPRLKKQESNQ